MSDRPTPMTDAVSDKWAGDPDARGHREELEDHARDLERQLAEAKEAMQSITGVEARVCEDVLTPFRNVARGIPDNWPGECILRFD